MQLKFVRWPNLCSSLTRIPFKTSGACCCRVALVLTRFSLRFLVWARTWLQSYFNTYSQRAHSFLSDKLRYMPAARFGSREKAPGFLHTKLGSVRKIYEWSSCSWCTLRKRSLCAHVARHGLTLQERKSERVKKRKTFILQLDQYIHFRVMPSYQAFCVFALYFSRWAVLIQDLYKLSIWVVTCLCGRSPFVTVCVKYCFIYVLKITSSWTRFCSRCFCASRLLIHKSLVRQITQEWPKWKRPSLASTEDKRSEVTRLDMCYGLIHPMRRCRYEDGWMNWQAIRREPSNALMPAPWPL